MIAPGRVGRRDGRHDASPDHYVEQHLYALQADPCEVTNPVGLASHRRAADVLRERLLRLMATRGKRRP